MGMKNKKIFLFIIFALAILISFYFDSEIIKKISLTKSDFLDDFFKVIVFLSKATIVFLFLTLLFFCGKKKRKIFPLWATLAFSAIISFLLKIIVHRQRPFQSSITEILPVLMEKSYLAWNFSFPSFQSMMVFSVAPLISKEFPKIKNIWIIFACFVALSRVYFGLHFLSDVIAGGLIGYLAGMIILKKEKFFDKIYDKIFRK